MNLQPPVAHPPSLPALLADPGALPAALLGWWMGVLGAQGLEPARAWLWLGVATSAVLGHMYSPWLGFRGGKGVATGFGAMLGVFPHLTWPALLALAVFATSARLTRYVGVSSCVAALSMPVWVAALRAVGAAGAGEGAAARVADGWVFLVATALLALLVVWKHRGNLARTLNGTEMRIGERAGPGTRAAEGGAPGAGR